MTATAVGSLPHEDPVQAAALVLSCFSADLPFWPQLPRRDERENMYVQFAEGLPGLTRDAGTGRWFVDTAQDLTGPMERLYAQVLGERASGLELVSETHAAGLYSTLTTVGAGGGERGAGRLPAIKGQITGPVSIGLAITDRAGRPILYDPSLMDCLVKLLGLKASWQQRVLEQVAERVLIVIDEPYLTATGTSVVNLDATTWVGYLVELRQAVTCLVGLHCCGNADWGEVTGDELSLDVLSFDALNCFSSIEAYARALCRFVSNGGALAWGIVPNSSEALWAREPAALVGEAARRLGECLQVLAVRGSADPELIATRSLLTPVCGLGATDVATAERAFEVLLGVARGQREARAL